VPRDGRGEAPRPAARRTPPAAHRPPRAAAPRRLLPCSDPATPARTPIHPPARPPAHPPLPPRPQVSYRRATTTQLALHIPLDAAVNADAVERYRERQVGAVEGEGGGGWRGRATE
jgi:hypothetical protein